MTRTHALIVFAVLALWAVPLYLDWRVAVWFLAGWMVVLGVTEYYARSRRCQVCWRGWALYRLDVAKRRPLGSSWSVGTIRVCKLCRGAR